MSRVNSNSLNRSLQAIFFHPGPAAVPDPFFFQKEQALIKQVPASCFYLAYLANQADAEALTTLPVWKQDPFDIPRRSQKI